MTQKEMADRITEALNFLDEEEGTSNIEDIRTFQEAGLLTTNEGLVIRLDNGDEFQITVIKSR